MAAYTPPPDATQNEYGYWILPSGDFAPGQDMSGQMAGATPAQRAATPGPVQTGADGKAYRLVDGQKWYMPPAAGPDDRGGGLVHGMSQWNPQTGRYDTPIDWGKVLSMVAAGVITAGAADAVLAASPALAATAPAGASAATALPAGVTLEGTAAGVGGAAGASTTVGAGTVAGELGPTTAASLGGTSAVVGGSTVPASLAAVTGAGGAAGPTAAAAAGGLSYGDLLKYGLPVAGNLVGSLVQANAAGNASDAQQKYLEEALAYQKESDLYNRGLAATALTTANQRYGDYQGRIAPFIANGTNSNDRMAALLGLPARTGQGSSAASYSGGSASGGSSGGSAGVAVSPEITAKIAANYASLGLTPGGRGSGPTDSAYYAEQDAATGGLTDANNNYWFGPNGRIATDAAKAGLKGTPSTSAASAPIAAPLPSTPTTPTSTPAPQPSAASVLMKAPDGSTKTVPADQVAHWQALGATLLGAA